MVFHLRCAAFCILLSVRLLEAQSERDTLKIYEQGYAAYQQGQYEEALSFYEHSLQMARGGQFRRGIALNLIGTGFLYGLLEHYDKAFPRLEEALQITRDLKLAHEVAVCLHSLGAVYFFSSQYDKALAHFEAAMQIPQGFTSPRDIADIQNNLGGVYGKLGEYDKALESFAEALKTYQQLKSPEDIAIILTNMATVYLFQQRYQDAERTSLEADQVHLKSRTPWRGKATLIEVYLATRRYAEALALLQATPPSWQESAHIHAQFHGQQGLAFQGLGRLPEASAALLKAFALEEERRQRLAEGLGFFGATSQGDPIRTYRALSATLVARALQGEMVDPLFTPYGQSLVAAAWYFAEATKARVLVERMAQAAKKTTSVALPPELQAEEAHLHKQLLAIHDQWSKAYQQGKAALQTLLTKKQQLTETLNTLIARLRREHPQYAALHYPKPLPPEALPFKDHEVLLAYAIDDQGTSLFRIRKGGVDKVWRLPVGKAELERQVQALLQPLQQPGGAGRNAFSPLLGHQLYQLLLADALQDVPPETRLMIVPDGILGLLPFETLVITPGKDLANTRFVGERFPLRYYQSATVFAFLRTLGASAAPRSFFALGHPIYDPQDPRYLAYQHGSPLPDVPAQALHSYAYRGFATRRAAASATRGSRSGELLSFAPLPETESEVKTIARLFSIAPQPPDVLLHLTANETRLRQTPLSRYRYLHFATHADLPGRLQGVNEPFLLLGQVENAAKDDGLLTLNKVRKLHLDAELVVLSACLTGQGSAIEGEGVVNFAHAFHHAGARSVVVGLWEVASVVTETYMGLFYQHLQAGKSKPEALSLARQEIKRRYPNPFFWAPFILHGEG